MQGARPQIHIMLIFLQLLPSIKNSPGLLSTYDVPGTGLGAVCLCVCVCIILIFTTTFSVRDDSRSLRLKGEDAEAQLFKDTRVESKEARIDMRA